MVQNNVP